MDFFLFCFTVYTVYNFAFVFNSNERVYINKSYLSNTISDIVFSINSSSQPEHLSSSVQRNRLMRGYLPH